MIPVQGVFGVFNRGYRKSMAAASEVDDYPACHQLKQ
jgi:hypothetical protein